MDSGVCEKSDAAASLIIYCFYMGRGCGNQSRADALEAVRDVVELREYCIPVLAQGLNPHACKVYCKR